MMTRPLRTVLLATLLCLTFTGTTLAQMAHGTHGMAADTAMADAMAQMHADMAIEPTGDADVDFMRAMIPHH